MKFSKNKPLSAATYAQNCIIIARYIWSTIVSKTWAVNLKSPGQRNSWNQINQFDEIFLGQNPFFAILKMAKNQILN